MRFASRCLLLLLVGLLCQGVLMQTCVVAVEPVPDATDVENAEASLETSTPPTPDEVAGQADGQPEAAAEGKAVISEALAKIEERPEEPPPFDYSPYRVLVWVASDHPQINADSLRDDLLDFLDRDFFSVWRTVVADAPPAVASIAQRDLNSISFEQIAASDPVIALKRGHKDSLRIHFASDAGRFLNEIPATRGRVQDLLKRIEENPEAKTTPAKFAWKEKLRAIDGDAVALAEMWKDESTDAILVSRGMADTLDDPKAKLIVLPLEGQVVEAIEQFDKIYVVNLQAQSVPTSVEVIELDTMMRHFGDVVHRPLVSDEEIAMSVGIATREAFSPSVRIDNAGSKSAVGLVRASGLALDADSPVHVRVGDVLEPMVRKDDRNGKPISIGPLDWAYLLAAEHELAAFGAPDASGVQPGDRIVSIASQPIHGPHHIQRTIRETPTQTERVEVERDGQKQKITIDTYQLEVERDGKPQEITITAGDTPALQPLYFGLHVREKTISGEKRTIVTKVLEESPASGKFELNDIILAVGPSTDIDAQTLLQTVVRTGGSGDLDFTIQRGESEKSVTVTLTPSTVSNRNQTAPSTINMDFYSGRIGGLQGRKNSRTHRMALRIRPRLPNTMLRLHAKGEPDEPLIGYEIYDRELSSRSMTFVGRTDWNGKMLVEKSDRPLRLLYVKNGGAVLARLPIVPGHHAIAIADLGGDDMRLQAEAYIRGVQNAIVDLVAIRELFKARIMMRIQEGKYKEADDLLEILRSEPSNEKIANDMGVKQTMFLKAIGRNANQRTKVDQMFTTTRELLAKQINPRMINDLNRALIEAKEGGGKPPAEKTADE